jgi:hypothetical protein
MRASSFASSSASALILSSDAFHLARNRDQVFPGGHHIPFHFFPTSRSLDHSVCAGWHGDFTRIEGDRGVERYQPLVVDAESREIAFIDDTDCLLQSSAVAALPQGCESPLFGQVIPNSSLGRHFLLLPATRLAHSDTALHSGAIRHTRTSEGLRTRVAVK